MKKVILGIYRIIGTGVKYENKDISAWTCGRGNIKLLERIGRFLSEDGGDMEGTQKSTP